MKKLIALILSLCMVFTLCACGNSKPAATNNDVEEPVAKVEDTEAAEETLEPVTLTVSITAANVDGNYTGKSLEVLKNKVEELSGGLITLDCYWSNTLYAQDAETAAVTSGDIFMTYSGSAWLTDGSPWVSMFASGYFFRDYEHMNAVLNGEIGQMTFQKIAEEQGILPLGAIYTGARAVSLNVDRCVQSRADLADINLRMPSSESWMFMGKALGTNPTAIAYSDLYLALSTGTVDGQENPASTLISASLYEVQKSVTYTGHVIDSVWPTVNLQQWNDLPEQYREWILEGVDAARVYAAEARQGAEAEEEEFLKENGMVIYHIDATEFAKEVQDYYLNSAFSETWDMDLYAEIQNVQ